MFGFDLGSIVFWLILYTLPWYIASWRYHRNKWPIAVINILFGWSFIGWGVALVWALSGNTDKEKYEAKKASR